MVRISNSVRPRICWNEKGIANAFPRTHLRPDSLVAPTRTSIRCAIYTRQSVSSDDGLSSCQIQFEACDEFVRSQHSNGWILLEDRFEDDGYSGATSDRPALKRLLVLLRKRDVDRVVVYRLDRLSRSLLGCASLLHEFRECGVGLVIVTALELGNSAQDGFMLNILAASAEFEREMIASRIAESRVRLKARGRRIASAVPFGYDADPRTKQMLQSASEAAVVKWMFDQAAAAKTRRRLPMRPTPKAGGRRRPSRGGRPNST
jgi:site-specific DNA recombinase